MNNFEEAIKSFIKKKIETRGGVEYQLVDYKVEIHTVQTDRTFTKVKPAYARTKIKTPLGIFANVKEAAEAHDKPGQWIRRHCEDARDRNFFYVVEEPRGEKERLQSQ